MLLFFHNAKVINNSQGSITQLVEKLTSFTPYQKINSRLPVKPWLLFFAGTINRESLVTICE
jgi:hypothetical protein